MRIRNLGVIWQPEVYQGSQRMKNYFEGWYFKVVSSSGTDSYAVIPGVSFGMTEDDSHSFIQILRGKDAFSTYHRFDLEEFKPSTDNFEVEIEKNSFSFSGMTLDIDDESHRVQANLRFDGILGWPVSRLSPGAMGPFRFLPRIQCLHGILSFDHSIQGHAEFFGDMIDFDNGRGYIEKDWGREFPSAWIWMQTNHFERPGVSFTSSIATIPFLKTKFIGFLIALYLDGEVYRFATYTRAKVSDIIVEDEQVSFKVEDKKHLIEVVAERREGGSLQSPVEGLMTGRIQESLTAEIAIKFYTKLKTGKDLVFEGRGTNAGLEVVGSMNDLGAREL